MDCSTVTLAADNKKFENTSAYGQLISDYQSTVLSAQLSGFQRDLNPGGATGTYSMQLSQGDINLNGSPNKSTDENSTKTGGIFSKVKLSSSWLQPITTQTAAFVSYTGQFADKNLDSSEKMQLGGMNGVRAYPTGEASGSDAQLVQVELRHNLESGINIAAFYDWGQVWLQHNPGPADLHNHYSLKGFGASISYTNEDGVNFKATWARRQGNNPNPNPVTGADQDGTRDRNRYWLQLSLPF